MAGIDKNERYTYFPGLDWAELGRRIRLKRKLMRQSHEWLAEQVGLSPGHIGNIESGSKTTSAENILLIAQALKTTPDYLMAVKHDADPDPEKAIIIDRIMALLNDRKINELEELEIVIALWTNHIER